MHNHSTEVSKEMLFHCDLPLCRGTSCKEGKWSQLRAGLDFGLVNTGEEGFPA
jgi:hypothetical protein